MVDAAKGENDKRVCRIRGIVDNGCLMSIYYVCVFCWLICHLSVKFSVWGQCMLKKNIVYNMNPVLVQIHDLSL